MEDAVRLSSPDSEAGRLEWKTNSAHFVWNLDEAGYQASIGGNKIVACRSRKKHEKNQSDSRVSISVIITHIYTTHTHTHTHTHKHAHAHVHAHTQTHTQTHTYTQGVESGNAAGHDGPSMYLMAGSSLPTCFLSQFGNREWLKRRRPKGLICGHDSKCIHDQRHMGLMR